MEDLEVLTDGGGREHCLRTTQLAPAPVRYGYSIAYRTSAPVPQFNSEGSIVDPDPHHFGNPDPYPQKNRIPRIRIKLISWIRNRIRIRINLQITSQNVWNMRLF